LRILREPDALGRMPAIIVSRRHSTPFPPLAPAAPILGTRLGSRSLLGKIKAPRHLIVAFADRKLHRSSSLSRCHRAGKPIIEAAGPIAPPILALEH
jgi:hypothetical protein